MGKRHKKERGDKSMSLSREPCPATRQDGKIFALVFRSFKHLCILNLSLTIRLVDSLPQHPTNHPVVDNGRIATERNTVLIQSSRFRTRSRIDGQNFPTKALLVDLRIRVRSLSQQSSRSNSRFVLSNYQYRREHRKGVSYLHNAK